uniref:trypsin n=1 Tax=Electrophorus electricus TaxID=8005 RepID=A0A4W4HMJ6_ELEEL
MKLLVTLMMWCLHDVAAVWRKKAEVYGLAQCVEDGSNGSEYSGTISVTASHHRCLSWNISKHLQIIYGLGSHKYCRNPDNSPMPWCLVRRNKLIVREFCKIPRCEVKPSKLESIQDTETTCGKRIQKRIYRIVGGVKSTIESQPWVASIFKGEAFQCGGTLITPCWVLTAAHCFPEGAKTSIHRFSVHLGKNAINETNLRKEQMFKVAKLVIHEDYTGNNYNNDIALLQIVDNSGQCAHRTHSVRTVCLPPPQQMLPSGSFCDIAGYGREKNSVYFSRFLKEAQVKLISQKVCQHNDYYGAEVTNNMFCAASPIWTEDACQGDSGGPLVCEMNGRMFLFGVISWGHGCATEFNPGVYTKVTNYNQWIAQHTGLPSFTKGIMYPQKD